MAAVRKGVIDWSMSVDDAGHRTYKLVNLVLAGNYDGPLTIMNTPGLPRPGAVWNVGGEIDPWAFCTPRMRITPRIKNELMPDGEAQWEVEQEFSTRSFTRCTERSIEDPLLMPPNISGSFVSYVQEVTRDRYGRALKTSSHEIIRGAQVEFDHSNPTVRIEQNLPALGLSSLCSAMNKVNMTYMWGLGRRMVKLSNASWERKLYGTCRYYYTRSLEFDINFNTFDRYVLDEGTKALNGHMGPNGTWVVDKIGTTTPNPSNPSHFCQYKDAKGENARVVLNGAGVPAATLEQAGVLKVEYYGEYNFFSLGIPASF